MVAALADAAHADDAFGELVARRHVFRAAEHMARTTVSSAMPLSVFRLNSCV